MTNQFWTSCADRDIAKGSCTVENFAMSQRWNTLFRKFRKRTHLFSACIAGVYELKMKFELVHVEDTVREIACLEMWSKRVTTIVNRKIRETASDQSLLNVYHISRNVTNHSSQVWPSAHVDLWRNTEINDRKRTLWPWSSKNTIDTQDNWSRARILANKWRCPVEITHEIVDAKKERNFVQSSNPWILGWSTFGCFHGVVTQVLMCNVSCLT